MTEKIKVDYNEWRGLLDRVEAVEEYIADDRRRRKALKEALEHFDSDISEYGITKANEMAKERWGI